MPHTQPFIFYTERRLVALTGVNAKNLPELLAGLREVSGASIFYHTHHQYLSHHFEKPVFYNNFARWISEALQEQRLAEQLAAIDLLTFTTIRQLREAIIAMIESYLRENGGRSRECPAGDEFHFCKSKSFIMPTGIVAQDVPDFFSKLPQVSNISLYFHFFEARLRLERPTNDFSRWLAGCGEEKLAKALDKLDPYIMTLDELKDEMVQLGKKYQ
ncbi:MAG: DUF5752 family protein [bacterium]